MSQSIDNNQALATVPESPLALMPVMTVEQAVRRYKMMVGVVRELLREGTDYGIIPGTDKPTLLKPGAEKLCTFFGLQADPVLKDSTEDWEAGFFYYRYQCRLMRGDQVIAVAEGSANSREKKYRWRRVPEWKATREEKVSAVRREELTAKNGKPYAMLTVENSEPFDLVNTLQKMAQKRAMIASTLLAVNASEFFTQDLEPEDDDDAPAAPRNGQTFAAKAASVSPDATTTKREAEQMNRVHENKGLNQWKCGGRLAMELIGLCTRLEAALVSEETWRAWLPEGVTSRKDLTEEQARQVIHRFRQRLETIKEADAGKWKCRPLTAIKLVEIYGQLRDKGINDETIKKGLPKDAQSFHALSEEQAQEALENFAKWLDKNGEAKQGEVVNG